MVSTADPELERVEFHVTITRSPSLVPTEPQQGLTDRVSDFVWRAFLMMLKIVAGVAAGFVLAILIWVMYIVINA
jgi:hypothetical protein